MSDTIHKKRKDWPHFNKIHLSGEAYAEGWDRIFGRKKAEDGEEDDEARRGRKVQKTRSKAKRARRQEP